MFYIYTYQRKKFNIQLLIIFLIVALVFSQTFSEANIYAQEESALPETEQTSENLQGPDPDIEEPEKEASARTASENSTESSPKEEMTEEQITPPAGETLATEKIESPQALDTKVAVESSSSTENTIESSSNTGGNEITPETKTTEETIIEGSKEENSETQTEDNLITTGEAQSISVVVNEANTTIVSDNFSSTIVTITENETEDINALETFETVLKNPETEIVKDSKNSINIDNDADIQNTVSSQANSGNNTATEEASITTGDATAVSGVVNVVNNTLIGNNWVFLAINVVGNWLGDLILPGEGLITTPATTPQSLDVNVTNDASIENNLTSDGNTGNNEAQDGAIQIGDAVSISSANTQANTTIIENNWVHVLVNKIDEASQGSGFEFDSAETENTSSSTGKINIVNEATLTSTVSSFANTGKNIIKGNGSIKTGTAIAEATVMNLVNTTIIGNNWIFVVVNVLGNWGGKVVFAYPDLSISTKPSKDTLYPYESFEYEITITNEGDADAKDVSIISSIPNSLEIVSNPNEISFEELKPGESKNIKMTLAPLENTESTPITISTQASTTTKEPNLANNVNASTLTINTPQEDTNSELKVSRSSHEISAAPGELVSYEIEISNTGETPLFDVIVEDAIRDQNNQRVLTYKWPISTIKPDQKYLINYTLALTDTAAGSTYTSKAHAEARNPEDEKVRSTGASLLTKVSAPFVLSAEASTNGTEENAALASTAIENVETKKPDSFPFLYWLGIIGSYVALVQGRSFYRRRKLAA